MCLLVRERMRDDLNWMHVSCVRMNENVDNNKVICEWIK